MKVGVTHIGWHLFNKKIKNMDKVLEDLHLKRRALSTVGINLNEVQLYAISRVFDKIDMIGESFSLSDSKEIVSDIKSFTEFFSEQPEQP